LFWSRRLADIRSEVVPCRLNMPGLRIFSLPAPLEDEPELVKGIIMELDATMAPATGAVISTAYETLPDVDEFVATREMPDSLNTFLMSRVMLLGIARGPAGMAKLAIEPFSYNGIKGVIILKEA